MVEDVEGLRFVFEKSLGKHWENINIDYRENWLSKGFVINGGVSC
ncbi:MAG TPA: hypothetical protein VFD15_06210 [Clostridia bacterium]|nr:hypothetical protein [Clostridia bacterium]